MPNLDATSLHRRLAAAGVAVLRASTAFDYSRQDEAGRWGVRTSTTVLLSRGGLVPIDGEAAAARAIEVLTAAGFVAARTADRWPTLLVTLPDPDAVELDEPAAAEPATLVVVNCTAAKADEPRPAGELYLGASYLFARGAADALAARTPGARVVILSALHGLLELDAVVAPYDVTFGDAGAITVDRLAAQLAGVTRVVALTPNRYTAALAAAADAAGVALEVPLAGCRGIGEQRGRLARIRDDRPAAEAPALPAVGEQLALFAT
jgi:hypothetical protein